MEKRDLNQNGYFGDHRGPCACFNIIVLFIIFFLPLNCLSAENDTVLKAEKPGGAARYAIAEDYVPVLNNSDIPRIFGGNDGAQLSIDDCGQMRELEFLALPGTVFNIENSFLENGVLIYRVSTADYPYATHTGYYIDSRLVRTTYSEPPQPERKLPEREVILANLLQAKGSRYIWGGNHTAGISRLLSLYPPSPAVLGNREMVDRWMLRGVDCSGLLYQATNGNTPRNTSSLVNYGIPVNVAGLTADDISRKLEPLDLIVWNGHVIIVLDSISAIESRLICPGGTGGVVVTSLKDRLTEIMTERVPADDPAPATDMNRKTFVVRRWYASKTNIKKMGHASEASRDAFDAVPFISQLPKKFTESNQILVVSGHDPKSICVTVQAFQREGKKWRPAFPPMSAVIGKNGFASPGDKREGDGKTPAGIYPLGFAFGYDKTVETGLPYRQVMEEDVWVDDSSSIDYNRMVKRSKTHARSFEKMRMDNVFYKHGIVLEYNMNPVVKNLGSAIFFHIQGGACVPTAGCIALSEADFLTLLRWLNIKEKPLAILGTAGMIRAMINVKGN